jgi:serine/threonine-protein kinase RsbT
MRDGFSTGGGLGLGLPGCKRLADDFHLDTTLGQGTRVTMTMWRQ